MSLSDEGWRPNVTAEWLYPESKIKQAIKKLGENLKKEFCSGFVSLSEECFSREWKKSTDKIIGNMHDANQDLNEEVKE